MASAIPQHLPQWSAMDFSSPPSFTAGAGAVAAASAAPAPQQMTLASLNSFRISIIADRLANHFEYGVRFDVLTDLCFQLTRGIDYALAINDVPASADRLPSLVKQVYQQRYNSSHQVESAITVLMISVKNACKNGWFPATDTDELINMATELCASFCTTASVTTEVSSVLDTILKIIPRFYPQLRLCRLIASFEAKPGYDCLMADIDIQRNIPPEEKILLFVAEKDDIRTSSCLISPPQVSFLVNGTGVERRNNVSLDSGPQYPTDITKMLRFGTNIIQAIGHFGGNYIIAITIMSKTPPSAPVLDDYIQPVVEALASDSEIIEGPSRISLNCPVSCRRIKTPVKGHLCKHHQCFDYENFMEMNLSKPSWRCPCCNQPASFIDLRIDQKMVKILSDVGDNIGDVIISADGTWKVVDHNDRTDQLRDGNMGCESSYAPPNCLDLTVGDESEDGESGASKIYRKFDNLDGSSNRFDKDTCETEDRKPLKNDQGFPVFEISPEQLPSNCTAMTTQGASHQIMDDICPRTWLSSSASNGSSVSTASAYSHRTGTLESLIPSFVVNPLITDAVSPALYREPIASHGASQPTFPLQNVSQVRQLTEIMQLQQPGIRNSVMNNETEMPPIPRNVNRTPVALQAFPVQTHASSCSQRTPTNVLNSSSNILSGSPSVSYQSVPLLRHHLITQNRDRQYIRNPSSHQAVGLSATTQVSTRAPPEQQRGAGAYRASLQPLDHLNPHHQLLNRWVQQPVSQCTSTSPQFRAPSTHIQQPSQNAARISVDSSARRAASRTGWMATDGSRPMGPEQSLNMGCDALRFDGIPESTSEQSWQPTARMRGSLTGSAYSAALSYYLARPVGHVPASSPMPPAVSSTFEPLPLQFANNINGQHSLT